MRILTLDDQRLEWVSLTWMQFFFLGILAIGPLYICFIALVEGELAAAWIPILVSAFAIVLFAFFVGKRTVAFDREVGRIRIELRSLLRLKIEVRDLDQLSEVVIFGQRGEYPSEIVDPMARRSRRARYKAVAKFKDGSELSLTGEGKVGREAHYVAQTVLDWLGAQKDAAASG